MTTTARSQTLVERAIARRFSDQYAAAEEDVNAIIEATYRVIERTGTVDPRVRDILAEAGLSSPAFYRHFASKDELLLVILDDGRRRLADYLTHQMAKEPDARGRVRAWIQGVAAQAIDRKAASRTRPFVTNFDRLAEQFPVEQAASHDVVRALLVEAIADAEREGSLSPIDGRRDAYAVFDVAFGFMERHVLARTRPSQADVKHLIAFCERALGI
jgi:AcrR family transcriptional regulator